MVPESGRRPHGAGGSWVARVALGAYLLAVAAACSAPPVHRQGPPEAQEVGATVPMELETLRSAVIAHMKARDAPPPVTSMWLVELNTWQPDWALTYVDTGGYLAPYRNLPAADRARDLLLEDFTYPSWVSEYASDRGPVPFRCAFVVHFGATTPESTRVSVYEVTPEVVVGKVWALAHEGIGFVRVDDIRDVEPTMTDRQQVVAWLETLAKAR